MMKMLDKPQYFLSVEQEVILKDSSQDDDPIAYLVFIRQPRMSLFNILVEGWMGNHPHDVFSKEKLIFYLMQTIKLVNDLHVNKYWTLDSILLENLFVDPLLQTVKFSSPTIVPMKPTKVRAKYTGHSLEMDSLSRSDMKNRDAKGIARLFY